MRIEQWWPNLKPRTRDWLIANAGAAVPAGIVAEISHAGGSISSDAWWVGEAGPSGFFISEDAADWIKELTNGEDPGSF